MIVARLLVQLRKLPMFKRWKRGDRYVPGTRAECFDTISQLTRLVRNHHETYTVRQITIPCIDVRSRNVTKCRALCIKWLFITSPLTHSCAGNVEMIHAQRRPESIPRR